MDGVISTDFRVGRIALGQVWRNTLGKPLRAPPEKPRFIVRELAGVFLAKPNA